MQTNVESVIGKTGHGTEGSEKGEPTPAKWWAEFNPWSDQNKTGRRDLSRYEAVKRWWDRLDKFWAVGTAVVIIGAALCLKPEKGPTVGARIKNAIWYLGVAGASLLVGDAVGSARKAGYGYGGMAICGLVGFGAVGLLAYLTSGMGTGGPASALEEEGEGAGEGTGAMAGAGAGEGARVEDDECVRQALLQENQARLEVKRLNTERREAEHAVEQGELDPKSLAETRRKLNLAIMQLNLSKLRTHRERCKTRIRISAYKGPLYVKAQYADIALYEYDMKKQEAQIERLEREPEKESLPKEVPGPKEKLERVQLLLAQTRAMQEELCGKNLEKRGPLIRRAAERLAERLKREADCYEAEIETLKREIAAKAKAGKQ